VANLRTRAVLLGDQYVVNGTKTFITSGTRADLVTTAVRTGGPGSRGISLLLIEKGTPGFTVSRNIEKMGWHASDTAELSFMDCQVPVENLLGEENQGFKGIMVNLKRTPLLGRGGPYRGGNGLGGRPRGMPREREAFGRPLTGFQVTPSQTGRDGHGCGSCQAVQLQRSRHDWSGTKGPQGGVYGQEFCHVRVRPGSL